jgi:hypothetical protein
MVMLKLFPGTETHGVQSRTEAEFRQKQLCIFQAETKSQNSDGDKDIVQVGTIK